MPYFWLKAFHIVGVVAWMAGLFYLPRLFVYHAESLQKPESERAVLSAQFKLMERRLYRGITTPAMILSIALGIGIILDIPRLLEMPWLLGKLGLVLLLVIYHLFLGECVALFARDECRFSPQFFRAVNEVPTVLLVGIVMLVVFKDQLPGGALAGVLGALAVLLAIGIVVYARVRKGSAA